MENIIKELKEQFLNDLKIEGDVWRIFRSTTFIDLIIVNYNLYQTKKQVKYLIEMFNLIMKFKLLSQINVIEVEGNLDDFSKKFNLENESIIKKYENMFVDLQPVFKNYNSVDSNALKNKIQNLQSKDLSDSNLYSNIDELAGILFNLLDKKNYY